MTDIVTKLGSSGNTILRIFSGTVPANTSIANATGVLLVQINCAPTFGTVAAGTGNLTMDTSTTRSNIAQQDGVATFFRVHPNSATGINAVIQGNVAMSGGDLNLNTTTITNGQAVTINSFVLTATGA